MVHPSVTAVSLCPVIQSQANPLSSLFSNSLQADLSELLGLKDYMGVMMFITFAEQVVPVSDERVQVEEELFDGVEVVVYQPRQERAAGEKKRAIIYLHGGGWCLGSSSESPLITARLQLLNTKVYFLSLRLDLWLEMLHLLSQEAFHFILNPFCFFYQNTF